VTALAARRRHPLASAVLVLLSLVVIGLLYALAVPGKAGATTAASSDVTTGKQLFQANCSTCHGMNAEGRSNAPSLVGVGAAAVDFQVGTGRMPLQASGPQAPRSGKVDFSSDDIKNLAAYVASLAPGPAIPSADQVDPTKGDPVRGGELFRTNCAMCHNFAANGGALTRGKYAPNLNDTTPTHIYEAMDTGPQSMPVFGDGTLDPKSKQDIIAWVRTIKQAPNPGGISLGGIGPVSEGLVGWVVGLAALIGCAVWLGAKAS
jgi:ubiquinol-cytochrome c reductase cytochrome c subunit